MGIPNDWHNSEKPVDFEEALAAVFGTGRFYRKVILAGSFSLLCSYIAITTISLVLPASQCDLQMDSKDKGYLISASIIGIAISCHLWGFLSDTLGRRYILTRCLFLDGLLYIITSITPNYSLILFWRFCNGFASCGGFVSLYAYVGEFHSNSSRVRALMLMSLFAASASILLPAIAWLILPGKWSFLLYPELKYKAWRLYYAIHGLPSLFCSFVLYSLPESPKFLLSKGEKDKALQVLQQIHKENSKKDEKQSFLIRNIVLNESEMLNKSTKNSNKILAFFHLIWNQTIPLLKPPHRFCLTLICVTQYLLFMSNGGLYLWLPETMNRLANFKNEFYDKPATYCEVVQYKRLEIQRNSTEDPVFLLSNNSIARDVYLKNNTYLTSIEETQPFCSDVIDSSVYLHLGIVSFFNSLALAVCVFLTSFIDKKYMIGFCISLSFLSAVILLTVNITEIIPIIINLTIVLSGVSIPIINSIAVDLFPTNMRGMASCFTLMFSRFGTITSNALAGSLIDSSCSALIWCFILSFIACLVLMLLIPKEPPYAKK